MNACASLKRTAGITKSGCSAYRRSSGSWKRRQAEEPVLLLLAGQRGLVDRAQVALEDLVLDLEVGAARAVPALVQALVGVPVVVHPLQHLLDAALVLRVGGADEEVVGDVQLAASAP